MVEGRPVALQNIGVPVFVVGTERDHVAPWKSVYKIHYLADTDVTFVLASGGHNTGIVSPPDHPRRCYRVGLQRTNDCVLGPEEWLEEAENREGSWWPEWIAWLEEQSTAGQVAPPAMGSADHPPIMEAPGSYVMER